MMNTRYLRYWNICREVDEDQENWSGKVPSIFWGFDEYRSEALAVQIEDTRVKGSACSSLIFFLSLSIYVCIYII